MALEVWFTEQIANILSALGQASVVMESATAEHTEVAQAFHAGYQTALLAVARAFGISPALPLAHCEGQDIRYLPIRRTDSYTTQVGNILRE